VITRGSRTSRDQALDLVCTVELKILYDEPSTRTLRLFMKPHLLALLVCPSCRGELHLPDEPENAVERESDTSACAERGHVSR
jgi:hypothetical protein